MKLRNVHEIASTLTCLNCSSLNDLKSLRRVTMRLLKLISFAKAQLSI